jgi:penicillin-binding protein 1B
MKKKNGLKKWFPFFAAVLGVAVCLGAGFGVLAYLNLAPLLRAFETQSDWTPTRVYSELTQFKLSDRRSFVEQVLSRMNVQFTNSTSLAPTPIIPSEGIQFLWDPRGFPPELLPPDLANIFTKLQETSHLEPPSEPLFVSLTFDSALPQATLSSIRLGTTELTQITLQPQIVAFLAQNDDTTLIRTPVAFDEIPSQIWQAIIAVEDQNFLTHPGLDFKGLMRAIVVNLKSGSYAQGGSTITQQLVKNLTRRRKKNFWLKINEGLLAILIELKFPKQQLLERYLNEVYLGQVGKLEVHGLAEGARLFFGKKLDALSLAEIAILAGLIKGPHYYSPYKNLKRCKQRQLVVLQRMLETHQISEIEAKEAANEPIKTAPPQNVVSKAPFFSDALLSEVKAVLPQGTDLTGLNVYTTLDLNLNQIAQNALAKGLEQLGETEPEAKKCEAALLALDQRSGAIKAFIGGKNYALSNFNRIASMKRQVGSAFKPIVYLAAILQGKDSLGVPYGPAHLIADAPWNLTYDKNRQSWSPKNYDKKNKGWLSFRQALAESNNVAAAKVGVKIGLENVVKTGQKLGIVSPLLAVPSLSLGSAELSPVEITSAFATIANHGIRFPVSAVRLITNDKGTVLYKNPYMAEQVVDAAAADLLMDMLQEVFTSGTAKSARTSLGFSQIAAGKTGTTSNYRDAWFIGSTSELTVGIWVGFDQSNPTTLKLTGAKTALPLWVSFMNQAFDPDQVAPLTPSPLLKDLPVNTFSGVLASEGCSGKALMVEKFINGVEPTDKKCDQEFPPLPQPDEAI